MTYLSLLDAEIKSYKLFILSGTCNCCVPLPGLRRSVEASAELVEVYERPFNLISNSF